MSLRLRRSFFALLTLMLPGLLAAQRPVADPVPGPITPADLNVPLVEVAVLPSSGSNPLTRINQAQEAPDGSGRLFVNDLNGPLRVIGPDGGVTTYVDLRDALSAFRNSPGLGTGFGSFAFHPDFARNGIFYTGHAELPGRQPVTHENPEDVRIRLHAVVTEWQAVDPSAATFRGTRRELVRLPLPGVIHGLQQIAFNPNAAPDSADYGMLYICFGDGGSFDARSPENVGRLDSPLGAIWRIDPQGTNSVNGQYGIPADNPFVDSDVPGVIREIYAYGFRNPHRLSWDRGGSGKLLSGDIGERQIEEVNLIIPGGHYGWPEREGRFFVTRDDRDNVYPLPADDDQFDYLYPVARYDHDEGRAIVGGYVYRGSAVPSLQGWYLCGDIANGRIFGVPVDELELGSEPAPLRELTFTEDGVEVTLQELVDRRQRSNRTDLRFGIDQAGELYVLTKRDGVVRKVARPDFRFPPEAQPGVWQTVADLSNDAWQEAWSFDGLTGEARAQRVLDPDGSGRRVLLLLPNDFSALAAATEIPQLSPNADGTVHLRLRTDGPDAEVTVGLAPRVTTDPRAAAIGFTWDMDGLAPLGGEGEIAPLPRQWHDFWITLDGTRNQYALATRAPGEEAPRTVASGLPGAATGLLGLTISVRRGWVWVDDVHVDNGARALLSPLEASDVFGGTPAFPGVFGSELLSSPWYGLYTPVAWPWVRHQFLGLQYVVPVLPNDVYLFDAPADRWFYTSRAAWPLLYDFADQRWIAYRQGTAAPREFWLLDGTVITLP